MIRDDFHDRLDDILSRWHHWAKGYIPVPTCGADPMFRNAKSPHSSHSAGEVTDAKVERDQLEAVEFHIFELCQLHRDAILIHARNCCTGRNVWLSPRLPKDPMERAQILVDAKAMLIGKLLSAGIM